MTCRRAMHERATPLIIEHSVCPANQPCDAKLVDIQMMVRRAGAIERKTNFASCLSRADLASPKSFEPVAIRTCSQLSAGTPASNDKHVLKDTALFLREVATLPLRARAST
jgi:hypothetical protein